MSSKSLVITFCIFLVRISAEDCNKIQLIQELDESTGLSYVIVIGGKSFMITEQQLEGKDLPIRQLDLPDGYNDSNVMLYFNQFCSPPQNYLIAYKFELDKQNQVYDWSTYLTLTNWTQTKREWSKSARLLPDFLHNNPYMNAHRFSFSMFWHNRSVLYRVQMPVQGASIRCDYSTIIIGINNTCERHEYLEDFKKKITEILNPYDDFEACFIHNDSQIICVGPKGFTSYDIDLEKTKSGHLRVENATKIFKRMPQIIKIIEDIKQEFQCNPSESTTTDIPETSVTLKETTLGITVPGSTTWTVLTNNSTENKNLTETTEPLEESRDRNWIPFVLFLLLILVLIIISAITLLYCFARKAKPKDDMPSTAGASIGGQQSNVDQMSNISMRTQFGDKNGRNESTIDSSQSMRSLTNTNDKKVVNKDMSNTSAIGDQPSMRSIQMNRGAEKPGMTGQSSIDSQASTRSQINTNDKRNTTQDMSNTSAIDDHISMRSQNESNDKKMSPKSSVGMSAIDSSVSMRSLNDSKQNPNQQ